MFSLLRTGYDNLSYRNKLLYSYLLLVFLPLFILCLASMYTLNRESEMRQEEIYSIRLEHTYSMLDTTFEEMLGCANSVASMRSIRACLSREEPGTLMEQAGDLETILSALNTLYYNRDLFSVRIFVPDEFRYSTRHVTTWPMSEMSMYFQSDQQPYLYAPVITYPSEYTPPMSSTQNVISIMMPIYHEHSYEQTVGIACVDIPVSSVMDILTYSDFLDVGAVFLLDANMTPMLSDSTEAASPEEAYALVSGKDYRVFYTDTLWNTYRIALAVPLSSLSHPSNLPLYILLLGLVLGLLVMVMASVYSQQNARRIVRLSQKVSAVAMGNLDAHCMVDSSDEIGDLQVAFNDMIDQMNEMLQEQYKLGISLNANELKLLQAQIDPHFLYNTLNLIIWTAQNRSSEEVCEIVQELSDYYRLSLSKGQDLIPLENEIRHVSLYVDLQNRRFENKIRLNISVDSGISQFPIPKLLLQPIVENSVVHGFGNQIEIISIDATAQGDRIRIRIQDNGLGLPPEEVERLMFQMRSHRCSSVTKGYGLANISERLYHLYGDRAGIEISSQRGSVTTVEITIPWGSEQISGGQKDEAFRY